jgi:hypothetical protein
LSLSGCLYEENTTINPEKLLRNKHPNFKIRPRPDDPAVHGMQPSQQYGGNAASGWLS